MSLHEAVDAYVVEAAAGNLAMVTTQGIATSFIDLRIADGWVADPEDCRQGLYIGVAQIVRNKLRKLFDPEAQDPDQINLDLPEHALLQERYSVGTGEKIDGRPEYIYVRRSALTAEQMRLTVARFRKISVHYQRAADALEASWYREHEAA